MPERPGWEDVGPFLDRIEVPGGWLYRLRLPADAPCLCFVPDPKGGWVQPRPKPPANVRDFPGIER